MKFVQRSKKHRIGSKVLIKSKSVWGSLDDVMSRNNPKSKPTDAKNPTGHIRNYKQVGCGGRLKWVYVVAYNEKSSGDFYLYEDLQPIPENTQFEEILSNNLFEI